MRIDKYLKLSRLIKRRTVAKEACEKGMVMINEKTAKPGDEVKIGDIIKVTLGSREIEVKIADTSEIVGKKNAEDMYKRLK